MHRRPFSRLTAASVLAEFDRAGPTPWEARVQDFTAGGIGVRTAVVVRPDRAAGTGDGRRGDLWPLLVIALDDRAERVEPGLAALLAAGRDGRISGRAPLPVWARWSVLDGAERLAKLTVRASVPVPLEASLVFPGGAIDQVLHLVALSPAVGLVGVPEAARLVSPQTRRDALDQVLVVPAAPSPELLALAVRTFDEEAS